MKKKVIDGSNKIVRDVLTESDRPLGAYEVLERAKEKGVNGPPTIYRALNRLIKLGLAHHIASTHRYVMCRHDSKHQNEAVIFAVCNFCDNVEEISDKAMHTALDKIREDSGFKTQSEVIEIVGMCRQCSEWKGEI